jgi:spectinomycin phosphotransferase
VGIQGSDVPNENTVWDSVIENAHWTVFSRTKYDQRVRIEILINREALLETVRMAYGLNVTSLEYLGVGMVSAYKMIGPSGTYFLKLFPDTPFGREAAARLEGEHALLNALREHDVLERIPRIVRALDGSTRSSFDGLTFAVYAFIEGRTLWGREGSVLEPLAQAVARLHAGASKLLSQPLVLPVAQEDFELPFEADLLHHLSTLEHPPTNARPGVLALRDLMLPRQGELLEKLERAKHFQRITRSRPRQNIVAHTDMHGNNLMLDNEGALWLLDWETARVAPAEHDLWMFHPMLGEFLIVYDATLEIPRELDADLFGFYIYRRTLEDLAVDVQNILNGNASDEQDRQDLEIVQNNVLGWWPDLERDLERVRLTLSRRRGATIQ